MDSGAANKAKRLRGTGRGWSKTKHRAKKHQTERAKRLGARRMFGPPPAPTARTRRTVKDLPEPERERMG